MPQLNPNPWFLIWLSSWLIFLLTMPQLITMFKPLNLPTKNQILNPLDPWHWPWP
uniref:ATP synthase complex subunit 8 n=1 Tax=Cynoglossus melampetalus TaxID=2724496 RepID=A0A7H0DGD5_9PLEU|nr:ATP synthase F0 subunit 8 [Cynoglossus melampetalus]